MKEPRGLRARVLKRDAGIAITCLGIDLLLDGELETATAEGFIVRTHLGYVFTENITNPHAFVVPFTWHGVRIAHAPNSLNNKTRETVHAYVDEPVSIGNLTNARGYLCSTQSMGQVTKTSDELSCARCKTRLGMYERRVAGRATR
jgi:hypothetical protein